MPAARGPSKERRNLRLEAFLPYRLSVLMNTMSRSLARSYAERFRLSVAEWRCMAVLGPYAALSAVDIAQRAAMDKVTVSRAVAGLTAAGHLERTPHARDRRRTVLRLSRKGRGIYDQIVPAALEYEARMMAALTPEQTGQLDQLLERLTKRARELDSRD